MSWKGEGHIEIGVPYECLICGTAYIDTVAAPWIEDPRTPDPKCLERLQQAISHGQPPDLSQPVDDRRTQPDYPIRMLPCPSCSEARYALPFGSLSITSVQDSETPLFWARPVQTDTGVSLYYRQSATEWRLMSGNHSPKVLHLDPRSSSEMKLLLPSTAAPPDTPSIQDEDATCHFFAQIHPSKLSDLNIKEDKLSHGHRDRRLSWSQHFFLGGDIQERDHAEVFKAALKAAGISLDTARELHAVLTRIGANEFVLEDYTLGHPAERAMNSDVLAHIHGLLHTGQIEIPLLGKKPKDLDVENLKKVFHQIQKRISTPLLGALARQISG